MGSHFYLWRHRFRVACWSLVGVAAFSLLMPIPAQEPDAEEVREKAVVDRFVTVLEKNPRRGTALDKVYGFHVERGSLNGLIKTYRDKAERTKATEAASAWMLVGLLESLRGHDAAAVEAFGKTEQLDPTSYLASYYLGLSQVLIGQPDKAAEALERATQRKPAQADQLDIFQALGRVYQRAQKSDKALDVWNRLEKQFPNDARVQEQIATTLLEEGEFASALPRFEKLAKTTKDKYRQSLFQMEAAEIKVRLGQSADAIKEFESLLGQLNPDNWLYREVRRRIEQVYLRTDDQAGLIVYYEAWMKKNPNDLGATTRLARLLAGLGRGPESQQWLEKALKIAPTNKELRLTLIGELMYEQKIADAIAQYEQLDKHEPNNPDTLREWGRAILKDTARAEATRKKDAAAVWKRMTESKPKDPLVAAQVAELFRQVEMTDDALELYQKAISLAPEAAQYKEYLGEYLHSLKRKDESLATLRQIAEGSGKTAANLSRLAEVLSGFGYLPEAIETNAEACKLDPREINLQIKQVDLLTNAERHDDALKQLEVVKKLAATEEEREAWLGRELKELSAIDKLKDRITELRNELDGTKEDAGASDKIKSQLAEKWFWLARGYEFERQMKEAAQAITKASELAPQSIPILMASGRIQESQNNLLAAVEINTKLAAVDRRFRTEYLKKVAQLELQLGRREKGIQAGRDLIAAAPGNPELYEFFSQLCFQLGETEEGLQALRRSVRVNPTEQKGLLSLAGALAEQFRTSEAIELYWRAFDKAATLEDRLAIVPKLTELYLQTNQFDRLLERLERQRREPNQQREMTISLAQAYQSAGDDGNARQELEKLLTEDTRDTQLLQQLVKLCESDGDLDMAVRYQQQFNKASPGREGLMRLAQLLTKAGESDEAAALMAQLTADEKDPEQVLKSIDGFLAQNKFDQASAILQKVTRDQPANWEFLYREGVILAKSKPEEAALKFEAIVAMTLNDDEQGVIAKAQAKKAAAFAQRGQNVTQRPVQQQRLSLQNRIQSVSAIRQAINPENFNRGIAQQQSPTFWAPADYGQARLASFLWRRKFAQKEGKVDELVKSRRTASAKSDDLRDLMDTYYLALLNNNAEQNYRILKRLSLRPDADREIQLLYLQSLQGRGPIEGDATLIAEAPADAADPDEVDDIDPDADPNGNRIVLAPLDKEELEHVIAIARQLTSSAEFNRQTGLGNYLGFVTSELRRSGRKAEARQLFKDAIDNAKEPFEIVPIFQVVIQRGDYATAIRLLDRLAALSSNGVPTSMTVSNSMQYMTTPQYQAQLVGQLMANQAQAKNLDDVLGLFKRYVNLVTSREAAAAAQTLAARRQQRMTVQNVGNQYVTIVQSNGQRRSELIDFPQPNTVYDRESIQMLRQAFVLFRDAARTSQLIDAFAAAAKDLQTPESERIMWQFGLGYLHWWNEEKDDALAVLNDASNQIPGNNEIKFEMARLREKRREFAEGLALIDEITPGDQAALQQREVMALRLSVNGGDIDRARLAAERLFGLRLDSNLQLALAQQMHQLGMHEQAEAVLARAGRQAGNKTEILGSLMEQYASTGKNDVAIQIAHQLLRRSKSGGSSPQTPGVRTRVVRGMIVGEDSAIRTQALNVLNRSGKLPDMIAKVESQLKNSPRSQRLLETLLEYYVAAGNEKKIEEVSGKLAELKVDDPNFKFQLAMKLLDAGKTREANEHLKVVFEKSPNLLANQPSLLLNKYRSLNKMEDLASLLESIDLKIYRQQPAVVMNVMMNVIRTMSQQDQTRDRGLALFKKAWVDIPGMRSQLLNGMRDESFWKLPEIFDYAREGIIPSETALQQNSGLVYSGMSYGANGKLTTLHTRVLDIATSQNKLDVLHDDVAAAIKRMPAWTGGPVLLGLIDLRKGHVEESKAVFETMLPTFEKPQGNLRNNTQLNFGYALREIGQELAAHDSCADLAIRYFEAAIRNSPNDMNEFQFTAGKPLFDLLKKQGRNADARQVLINGAKPSNQMMNNNPGYDAYRRMVTAVSIGKEFQDLGYPADAIKIYQKALSNSEDVEQAQQWGGDQYSIQLKNGLSKALEQLKPESLADLLAPPVKPVNVAPSSPAPVPPGSRRARPAVEEPTEDFSSVDLIVSVDSSDLMKTRMSSALVNLVTGLSRKPHLLETTISAITDARKQRPDDFGAAILATQIAFASRDLAVRKAAVDELVAMIDRLPLEPPSEKGEFMTKHRVAAMQQAQLWLIARECYADEELRTSGEKLGTRALEAAKRVSDGSYALAILREWGQIAIDAKDPKTASQKWTEMLDLVIPKASDKPKKAADAATAEAPQVIRTVQQLPGGGTRTVASVAAARNAAAVPQGTKGHSVTLSQFQKAAQIAMLAAENGLDDLSISAIEQSLHAGPPLEAMQDVQQANPFGAPAQVNDQSQSVVQVQLHLAALEQIWRRKGVGDERIYRALRGTLLPETRLLEVFVYPQPLATSRVQSPQSIGALAVRAAIRANQADDLKKRLETRLGQPLGELPARIVLTQLALALADAKAAGEQLDLIAERIKLDSLVNTSDMACHAAVPAIDIPELTPRAIIILERAADHYAHNQQNIRNSVEEPIRSFRFKLADLHFRSGNVEAGKKHLAAWVTQLATMWSNYGGDYPQYRRKSEYLAVAAAYARYGQRLDSLEVLGRHADLPVTNDYGEQPAGLSGSVILYGLAKLPPAEQYSALKSWSLPTSDRRSVRLMSGLLAGDAAPPAFDTTRDATPRFSTTSQVLSTADLLVRSAAEIGKIDELRKELEPLAAENVENAQFLLLLTRLVQPTDAQIVADLRNYTSARRTADAEADRNPNSNRRPRRPDTTNAIIAGLAVEHDVTREAGLELCHYQFERGSRFYDQLSMGYLRHMYNSTVIGPEKSSRIDRSPWNVDQKYWTGSAHTTANNEITGSMPLWWLAHEGKLQHICGPGQGYLFFNYPLTGTFEFSCDIWLGPWADGNAGYGGLVFDTLNSCQTFPVGRREHVLSKPNTLDRQSHYNRIRVQVTPNSIKSFVNGALAHEEKTSSGSTTPWLLLQAERDWQTAFTNLRIEGQPTIPESVSLSSSPTLLGWSGAFYGETLPQHFPPVPDAENQPNLQRIRQQPGDETSWYTVDGEIRGRQLPTASLGSTSVMQSRLQYHRPLRNGEQLSYEFWYEPGPAAIHVHPALDRLAMLLQPDGVKLHWMTESNDDSLLTKGLLSNNTITDDAARRGPPQLPLKPKDWNRVIVSLKNDTVSLLLNGTVIFERPLEPENDRQFSLYHDKHATSVRVRNVVLKGDWPKSLSKDLLANLLAPARDPSPDERHRLARLFDEKYEVSNLDHILQTTRGLSLADRYAALKKWVLPTDDHSSIRMYGDTTPADPVASSTLIPSVNILLGKATVASKPALPASTINGPPESSPVSRRRRSGGELIAPALDLIAVARELGKLDELAQTVRAIPESSPFVKRSRLAMLALIAMSGNDVTSAETFLRELTPGRDKGLPDDLPPNERWPELIVAAEATKIPELRNFAMPLLDLVLDSLNRKGIGFEWDVKVRSLWQRANYLRDSDGKAPMASAVSPKGQWAQATLIKASNRGSGLVPRWRFQGTNVTHLGGEGNDLLYFQSPLRGSFTVEGELSTFGWREARPMYATQWAGPQYTLEMADIGNLASNWAGPRFPKKLEPMGDWFRMRLEVTPEKATYYANGEAIHEQLLSANADPWFAIHSYGHYAASIRSLQITGEPEIPTELRLSTRDDLQGWWGDMYGDSVTGDNAMWKKNGDEINGTKLPGWQGRLRESLLQYHRPMLEDGDIACEFFYVPDQTHMHPALGRMVMLLEADGVKEHWLTDAQYERGGLALDNVVVEQKHRRGPAQVPLKANDWNKLNLSLRGDTLTLTLNDKAIYERPLEAENLRTFGLFHYAGDTDVRVRNVVYRGNWPRTLPSIGQQELAVDDLDMATFKEGELPEAWSTNFKGPLPGHLRLTSAATTTKFSPGKDGLRIVRDSNAEIGTESAGIQWPDITIEGDFEVTLGYRDFQSQTKSQTHQVPRVEIILAMGGTFTSPQHAQTLAMTHRRRHDDNMFVTPILGIRRNPPAEEWQSSDRRQIASEGRLRIVRRSSMAYYLFSKAGSDNWELLDRFPATTASVKDLIIGLRSEDLTSTCSVVLTEFSIRAKRIPYRPKFAEDELPARFRWNFQGPLPNQIEALSAAAPNKFEPVADGIKIDRPEDPRQSRIPVGFNWQGSIHGDFEVTLGYHDFESKTKMIDWQVPRIEIHVPIEDIEGTPHHKYGAAVFHLRRADGTLRYAGGINERKSDALTTWSGYDIAATKSSGRLRFIRQGKMLFSLAAEPGSDDFKVIFSGPATDTEVKSISCTIKSEGQESSASVVFTEFSIRAQSFDTPLVASTTKPQTPPPADTVSTPIPGPAAFGARDLPAVIKWNFQGPRPRFFREWGSTTKNSLVASAEGIKVIRRADVEKSEEAAGFQFDGGLDGDFEITLEYRDFVSKSVLKDWQVPRVDMSLVVNSATDPAVTMNSIAVAHRRNYDGGLRLLAVQGNRDSGGKLVYKSTEAKADRASGRLRLVRQESVVFYQAAAPGSDEWLTISRGTIEPGPVKWLSIGLRAEDLQASGEVVLTNITIRANSLLPD